MSHTKSFINGEFVDSPESYLNIDPSTGQSLGAVARGTDAEVDRAVQAARGAQKAWSRTSPEERANLLTRLSELILQNQDELARMESEDAGKPLSQARADAAIAARYFQFYGRAIDSYYGLTIPLQSDMHVYTRREPFGVTGHVLAWNYPMQLFSRAVAPAIATGNCSVVKPADETPRTAVRIAELAIQAGVPRGVLNVVTGIGSEAGAALSAHADVDHIGFVGSTQIGSVIAAAAAERVVPAMLELGGKSAHLVFPDADLNASAFYATKGILANAGQTCSAGSRLLVHSSIYDQMLEKIADNFRKTSIGPGLEDKDLGPLVSLKQQGRVRGMVDAADGEIVFGGGIPENLGEGAFFQPTLISGVDPLSKIAQEEVFGPVLVAMAFDTEEEAVALANGTEYGLMSAVWTRDLARAHRLSADIHAGQVYVNAYGAGGGVELPFGGFKKSGYGREKGYEALDAYTETKTVIMKL
ncbi:aldehyde dehydrogenase family protein [Pseudarthrobacter oxydans]|uniref:aldehyde dehydrogenase family protein n=1 Tax=Pseudarthrobacter oxydans TaxID=1671 RepID=UPI002AA6B488|nr:aldehyde dehydrogenase family protein [Pseudarthrobacter oxydans]WPU11151.1 aldehyde dehydrogenase family protein [Pseudarthrobacter oxydans]